MTSPPPPPAPHDDDPLVFTPVATASTRHDGWSAARQLAFIEQLATHGGVAAAARAVGMTPQSANRLRKRADAASFAAAWDAALEEGRLRSLHRAIDYARDGRLAPITRMGKLIGHRRVFDNRLLFAACYGEPLSRYDRGVAGAARKNTARAGANPAPDPGAFVVLPELSELSDLSAIPFDEATAGPRLRDP